MQWVFTRWRQALGMALVLAVLVPVPVLAKGPSLTKLLAEAGKELAIVNRDEARVNAADARLLADQTTLAQRKQSGGATRAELKRLDQRVVKDRARVRTDEKDLRQAERTLNKTANELFKKFGTNYGF